MLQLRLIRGFIGVLIGVAALWPTAASAVTSRAQISGRITAADGTAISAYTVCAYAYAYDTNRPETGRLVSGRAAGASGDYALTGLPPGTYVIGFADCAATPGTDAPEYAGGGTVIEAARQYALSRGRSVTGVDARLRPGTSISGTVTAASDARPLGGICVDATTFGTVTGPLAPTHGATAADGTYSLTHLPVIGPAASYTLTFTDCNTPRRYLATPASAPADPTVAQPATGVDAALAIGASISGTVVDAGGATAPGGDVCVSAQPADYLHSGALNTEDMARTDGTGHYSLGGLAPDAYAVRFGDCTTDGSVHPGDRNDATVLESVRVGDGQAVTHDERLMPGATITGHVYAGPGRTAPVAGACVRVTTQASLMSVHAPYLDEVVTTDRRGAFTLGHLAPASAWYVGGAWIVSFATCDAPASVSWFDGASAASQATPLRLAGGARLRAVDGHLPVGRHAGPSGLAALMAAALPRLLRPVATVAHTVSHLRPWTLPRTSVGTWSARVELSATGGRRGLVIFRGRVRLRSAGRARLTLHLTAAGRRWVRSAAARHAVVHLHAVLSFRPVRGAAAITASSEFVAHPR